MMSFMEKAQQYLGEYEDSPSVFNLSDEEGKAIAKKLSARYLGFKSDYNCYWFEDKKYNSSYTGRTLEDSLKNKKNLWHRFSNYPN